MMSRNLKDDESALARPPLQQQRHRARSSGWSKHVAEAAGILKGQEIAHTGSATGL